MERDIETLSIQELRGLFADIAFPEYQREPDVWSREQKQRLLDSVLRRFDIASIYLYRREDGGFECIDGRQRLNAMMSFLGANPLDVEDDGFPLKIHNEISANLPSPYEALDGHTYAWIEDAADTNPLASQAVEAVLGYEFAVAYLSAATVADEFNLQFLRLNLGSLINAGEKLNAMVGNMRDLLFEPRGVGGHAFLDRVGIPTRRFAKQLTAAQVLLQAFSQEETESFARARHFDLQKFVKAHVDIQDDHPIVADVSATLDALEEKLGDATGAALRNRAIAITVIVFARQARLFEDTDRMDAFADFLHTFLGRLKWQVGNMKDYAIDERYDYLVEFQRHLTQASVEKSAVTRRHEIFEELFTEWLETGRLRSDDVYEKEENEPPPVA